MIAHIFTFIAFNLWNSRTCVLAKKMFWDMLAFLQINSRVLLLQKVKPNWLWPIRLIALSKLEPCNLYQFHAVWPKCPILWNLFLDNLICVSATRPRGRQCPIYCIFFGSLIQWGAPIKTSAHLQLLFHTIKDEHCFRQSDIRLHWRLF